jgi:hypothetical protein
MRGIGVTADFAFFSVTSQNDSELRYATAREARHHLCAGGISVSLNQYLFNPATPDGMLPTMPMVKIAAVLQ